ncbi:hypothetical protein BLD48_05995 [Exiguobacterium sp. KRL4]|uniref:hypothetical protein n=1 Tax=Exiguobacterium sp. KRL4 TaxID=1914536 RepID=UPI0008F974A9|nr:hypothetical protein [Exiguobacterium sp. KRL4]OIN67438.1 hypothetical protein BLD48_05995 [Exiguobacterium sp. KRL4]
MKQREFYCTKCGLFHWKDKRTGVKGCPNAACISNGENEVSRIYGVSSMAYAYYVKNHIDEMKSIAWSSLEFAPDYVLEYYKKQSIKIKL